MQGHADLEEMSGTFSSHLLLIRTVPVVSQLSFLLRQAIVDLCDATLSEQAGLHSKTTGPLLAVRPKRALCMA